MYSALLFLWGVLSLGYAPGALLLYLLARSSTPLEHVSLAVTLGLVTSGIVYWLVGIARWAELFVVWPPLAVACLLYLRRRDLKKIRVGLDRSHLALAVVLMLGVIALASLPMFFGNLTIGPDGGMNVVPTSDVLLHLALANELTHAIPPQNPVFAGHVLSYHYGMDLVVAMIGHATGVAISDLTVRFVPTLFVIVGMLTTFCFCRRWLGSGGFGALTVFLVFFGEDLSFVPGLLMGWAFDWTTAFNVPSVFSLFHVNPMLPALGLLFAGLFCLQKYLEAPDRGWLVLSAVCFAALVEVKVFTAAHVLGSLGTAALVYAVSARRFELLTVTAITAVLASPLLLNVLLQNQEGAQIAVIPGPAGYVAGAMQRLGIHERVTSAPALLGIGLPLFLLASLGLRLLGGWAILKALIRPLRSPPLRFMLALYVLAGIVLTLMLRIVPEGQGGYDNGVWFFVQSKFVAWIFAVEVLRQGYERLRSVTVPPLLAGSALVLAVVTLAVPSTVQHFLVLAEETAASDPEATRAAMFVASVAQRGDVVLSNQAVAARVLAFVPVRLPVGYFANTMVSADRYMHREALVIDFWRGWEAGDVRSDILRELGVRYISATTPDRLSLPPGVVELYSRSGYVVLKVNEE